MAALVTNGQPPAHECPTVIRFSLIITLFCSCADITPISDGKAYGPVITIQDWFTSCYLLKSGDKIILFDACWRTSALKSGLEANGVAPEDVTHVLMTHGHSDHTGGLALIPQAKVLALRTEQVNLTINASVHGAIDQTLHDGQEIRLGNHTITVIAVPGHTPGTAVYWVDGTLILGDAAITTSTGAIAPAPEGRSKDPKQAAESLAELSARLGRDRLRVDWLVPAHSGGVEGVQPLSDFLP